jgi:hypothetical protein
MKRESSYVLASTLGIAIISLIGGLPRWFQTERVSATRNVEAAFRDGLFQARLDAQNGRKPHIASGRWNAERDRALFITGYEQGYREFFKSHSGKLAEPNAAELAGHRDGMLDGARHRKASQPFQVDKTDNYRNIGAGSLEANSDSENYKRDYRQAYSTGYQRGYYSQQEELKAPSDTSGRWK